MGTETVFLHPLGFPRNELEVKLNNPLMGTETVFRF